MKSHYSFNICGSYQKVYFPMIIRQPCFLLLSQNWNGKQIWKKRWQIFQVLPISRVGVKFLLKYTSCQRQSHQETHTHMHKFTHTHTKVYTHKHTQRYIHTYTKVYTQCVWIPENVTSICSCVQLKRIYLECYLYQNVVRIKEYFWDLC